MRSETGFFRRIAVVLAVALLAVMLLTSCGGGGGGGSTGGNSSTVEPTPTPTPDPVPDPTPTPTPTPEPSSTVTLADAATGIFWVVSPTSRTTGTIVGYDKEKGTLPQNVTFPEKLGGYTITAITGKIFDGENVVELIVPETVTEIGDWAFASMSSLKKATIKGPAKLGEYLFCYDGALEEVNLNDNIKEIPDMAFAYCSNLKITLPAKLESIGNGAFYLPDRKKENCQALKLPETLTSIGNGAFHNAGINEVVIPSGVKKIGNDAFCGTSLSYIKLPSGTEEIGESAFASTNAQTIYLPHSVTHIEKNAFGSCRTGEYTFYYEGSDTEWSKISIDAGNDSWKNARLFCNTAPEKYDAIRNVPAGSEVVWKFEQNGAGVTLTGYDKNAMTPSGDVVLPESISTVSGTFAVTKIGSSAFEDCKSITSVQLPEGVTVIEKSAFSGCTKLASVSLPSGLRAIGNSAFELCSELRAVELPKGLLTIGEAAFKSGGLVEIVIPANVTGVGNGAFSNNQYLKKATVKGNTQFGTSVFWYCPDLKEVWLNDEIEEIPASMFDACYHLEKLHLPANLKKIGNDAFYLCYMKEVKLPNTVVSVGENAFKSAFVSRAALSEKMTTIPRQMFYESQLSEIYIPASVTSIELGAFGNCYYLRTIYYGGSEEEWENIKVDSVRNEALENVQVYYNASVSDLGLTEEFNLLSLLGF